MIETIMKHLTLANFLKVCAVAVAAPRYVGAFSAAVGVDGLTRYTWLVDAEAFSGAAMAVLEGFAIAFVLSKWRMLRPGTTQWFVVLALMLALMLTLPFVAAPYLLASQTGLSIAEMLPDEGILLFIRIAWSIAVALVPVLIVAAVGYADVDEHERKASELATKTELRKARMNYETELKESGLDYKCDACGKGFTTRQGLAAHSRWCDQETDSVQNGKLPELEADHA
jgi:hypothetical protein